MTEVLENDASIRVVTTVAAQVEYDFDFLAYTLGSVFAVHTSLAGVETELLAGTDFTVAGLGVSTGGTIDITLSGIVTEVGDELLIYRSVPIKRPADYAIELRAAVLNRELDETIMMIQELRRDADRAVKVALGYEGPAINLTDAVVGETLAVTAPNVIGRGPTSAEIENAQGYAEAAAEALAAMGPLLAQAQLIADNLNASIETITPHKLLFEGNGVLVDFALGQSVGENTLDVFISGVWQNSDTWSITGAGNDTLTLSAPAPAPLVPGEKNIEVRLGAQASVASTVVGPNSVGPSQLQASAVTAAAIAALAVDGSKLSAGLKAIIDNLNARAIKHYGNKASAEAATIDSSVLWSRTTGRISQGDGGGALFRNIGGAAPASGYPSFASADGANWEFVPTDWSVTFEQFGAVGDGVTDDYAACQAAIDFIYARGGGSVRLGWNKVYAVSNTLYVWQRVRLIGVAGAWTNQYSNSVGLNAPRPLGSAFFLLAGVNKDVVQFRFNCFNDGGLMKEAGNGRFIGDWRHHGGAFDVCFWGNRGNGGSPPTQVERNNLGNACSVYGARYVWLERNAGMFAAENGFAFLARDYTADFGAGGVVGSNNQRAFFNNGHSNAQNGFLIAMYDSLVHGNDAGNNGKNGFAGYHGQSFNNNAAWNNLERGFHLGVDSGYTTTSALSATYVGNNAYDNEMDGHRISGNGAPIMTGCFARANGRNLAEPVSNRCNYVITSTARGAGIVGCQSAAWDYDAVTPITHYGFLISNPTYKVAFAGNQDRGCTVPLSISTPANIIAAQSVN